MTGKELVSIIIRTKNEERWISSCLNSVFSQDYKNFEVIIVDDNSQDNTLKRINEYPVKVVHFPTEFRPGKSLNQGIKAGTGEFVVCLSGHCIPVDDHWLSGLLKNFDDPLVAGVYGRQEPLSFTPDVDKRDLLNTFRLERIVQTKDSFFHNANSMLRRSVWEAIPFDEQVTNIEDRLWGKAVIERGLKIIYEPQASVYHYHGINQSNNPQRCSNVVKILEEINVIGKNKFLKIDDARVVALVPIRGGGDYENTFKLMNITISDLKKSKYIKSVFVITEDERVGDMARQMGAEVPFIRPESLSSPHVNITDIFQFGLNKLEEQGIVPDLVVLATITYPFRPNGIFDTLIEEIKVSGVDTVVSAYPEYRISWRKDQDGLQSLTDLMPRKFKDPIQVGLLGLGCVAYPFKIRGNELMMGKVGLYEVNNYISTIEVRTQEDISVFSQFIKMGKS